MTPEEFDVYMQTSQIEPVIRGTDFPRVELDQPNRMLCKGYTVIGRVGMTIWLDWRQLIGREIEGQETVWKEEWPTSDLYPSKRAYREETDLRFALLMRDRHIYPLSFTTWRITA